MPGDKPYFIQSNRVNDIVMVVYLIDELNGIWKENVILATFNKEEARRILSIPLAGNGPTDKLRWHFEKSSDYTVRIGYRLLLRGFLKSNSDLYKNIKPKRRLLYKHLWETKVPEKMKITTWGLINNYVPTRHNLHNAI